MTTPINSEPLYSGYLDMDEEHTRVPQIADSEGLVDHLAEALANQIAMRKGCPPIRGCLALMPPHMAEIFRDDARAAIAALASSLPLRGL